LPLLFFSGRHLVQLWSGLWSIHLVLQELQELQALLQDYCEMRVPKYLK
jgi:hypothetical protein